MESRYFSVSKPRVIEDKRKKKPSNNEKKNNDPLCFMRYVFNFETHVKCGDIYKKKVGKMIKIKGLGRGGRYKKKTWASVITMYENDFTQ